MMQKDTANSSNVTKPQTVSSSAQQQQQQQQASSAPSETSVIGGIRNVVTSNASEVSRQMAAAAANTFSSESLQTQDPSSVQSSQFTFSQIGSMNDRSGGSSVVSSVASVIQQPPQATASTSSVAQLLQDSSAQQQQHQRSPQNQSSPTGTTSRSSFTSRNDVFAKPLVRKTIKLIIFGVYQKVEAFLEKNTVSFVSNFFEECFVRQWTSLSWDEAYTDVFIKCVYICWQSKFPN